MPSHPTVRYAFPHADHELVHQLWPSNIRGIEQDTVMRGSIGYTVVLFVVTLCVVLLKNPVTLLASPCPSLVYLSCLPSRRFNS